MKTVLDVITATTAFFQKSGGVIKRFAAASVLIDKADKKGRSSDPLVQALHDLNVLRNKARFKDKILRWITGNGKLGSENQVGAGLGQSFVRLNDLFEITLQVAYCRVDLRETNLHALQPD